MAYTASLDAGSQNYGVYNNGARVATTAAAGLVGYGLSTTNLSGTPTQTTPGAPAVTPAAPAYTPVNLVTPTTPAAGTTPINYQLQPNETITQYNARIAAANPNLPAPGTTSSTGVTNTATVAPPLTQIGSTVQPPTTSGTPTLPQATAPQAVSTYTTGVAATLAAQTAQLTAAYQQQQQTYQTKIDAANQQASDASQAAQAGLLGENNAVAAETQQKQAALATEQQQYNDNYNAIQGLAAQASALVQTSQTLTAQMQGMTGLSSIMSPRISQTAANLTANLAVINGAVNIYNGQIGAAQAQLTKATDAITSIYGDQISYYQSIVTYYDSQQSKDLTLAASLSTDQKTYIDAQIKVLSDQVAQTQATATYISNAMINPTTALQFAQAGVTLNDSIPQITVKLATAAYSSELSATSQKMAAAGYSQTAIPGVTPVTTIDSQGKSTNWYANTKPGAPKTYVETVNGQRIMYDGSGNVIADLGAAPAGSSATPGGIVFSQANKTALQGAGETASSIAALQSALNQYGAQSVLDNGQGMSDATKQWIEDTYGVSPTPAPASSSSSGSNIFSSAWNYLAGQ